MTYFLFCSSRTRVKDLEGVHWAVLFFFWKPLLRTTLTKNFCIPKLFFLDMAIVHTNRVDLQGYPVTFEIRVSVDTETFVSEKESFRILKFPG